MVAVPIHVLTPLDHSPVAVTLDTLSTMMECPVMVSTIVRKMSYFILEF